MWCLFEKVESGGRQRGGKRSWCLLWFSDHSRLPFSVVQANSESWSNTWCTWTASSSAPSCALIESLLERAQISWQTNNQSEQRAAEQCLVGTSTTEPRQARTSIFKDRQLSVRYKSASLKVGPNSLSISMARGERNLPAQTCAMPVLRYNWSRPRTGSWIKRHELPSNVPWNHELKDLRSRGNTAFLDEQMIRRGWINAPSLHKTQDARLRLHSRNGNLAY